MIKIEIILNNIYGRIYKYVRIYKHVHIIFFYYVYVIIDYWNKYFYFLFIFCHHNIIGSYNKSLNLIIVFSI